MEVSIKWCYGGCFINAQVMLLNMGCLEDLRTINFGKKIISMCSNNKMIINSVDVELIACLEYKL